MRVFFFIALIIFPQMVFASKNSIEKIGDHGQYIIPVSALVFSCMKFDGDGVRQYFNSSLFTMGTTYALKFSINARRPNNGKYSFPSGHTASSFMGAAYLHRRYGARLAIPAIAASTFVGFSRVHAKKHHVIDVLAASGIAYGSGYLFNHHITPVLTKDCAAIEAEWEF